MNEFNIIVDIKNNKLIAPVIELVQNDYNSTKLKFNFVGDDNYTKVFQLQLPDGSIWIKDIVNNQVVLADEKDGQIVPILVQNGKYIFDIAVYSNNTKLTTTNQESFFVRSELSGQDVELDDRVPILDGLIHSVNEAIKETDNLDIDIENSIIKITKKDGTIKTENVKGDKGDKGDAGAIKMRILDTLPETGSEDTLYFKKLAEPTDNNLYEEYVWIDNKWEFLGNKNIDIDLADYQKATELEEKPFEVTYEDGTTETIRSVVYK